METIEEVRMLFAKEIQYFEAIGDEYAQRARLGGVMGGVPFTLADFAFAVASNWQKPGSVSLSSNITFLGTAKGECLIAEARCVKNGRTTSYYRIDVTDELGNPVAAVTTTGYHK